MKINPKLLESLVKLVKQYSEEDFRELASFLTDEPSREKLVAALLTLSETAKRRAVNKQAKVKQSPLQRLQQLNADRFTVLKEVLDGIAAKVFLHNPTDLKDAASSLGIGTKSKRTRKQLAEAIALKLAQMADKEFLNFRERFLHPHKGSDNEYSVWSKLILNK